MSSLPDHLQIPPEVAAEMTPAVRAFVEVLLARIAKLEAEVAEWKRKKTPQNSSLPPSSEHPHAKATPETPKSGRKRGGQPGHAKCERPLIPTGQCDEVVVERPVECRRCGSPLAGDDPEPIRHQVCEIPEIKPHVTEYQLHRLVCPCCRVSTCAELPQGVPAGQSGPRLVAFAALLMACFRQSKRRTSLFLESLLGQPCSTGLTVKLQNIATDALRPCYDEACAALPHEPRLNIDESPTKQAREKAWLWTFVAAGFTVFRLATTRAATVMKGLLGEDYSGVVMCDRAKMYLWVDSIQWCWAHLKRDFQAISEVPGKAGQVGRQLVDLERELFHDLHLARDGTLSQRALKRRLLRLHGLVFLALEEGATCGHAPTEGTCGQLLGRYDALWAFLDDPLVSPTNNAAERALRHAVIWRKLSFGTQSDRGSRFVETLLTVIETCRQQDRPLFPFVTEAIIRSFAQQSPPSLFAGV